MSETLVVAHAGTNIYVGTVEDLATFEENVEKGLPVVLRDARNLIVRYYPTQTESGGIAVAKSSNIGPPDACIEAIPTLRTKVDTYYVPEDANGKEIEELLAEAEEMELRQRAGRAGIHTPPAGRTP